jgi:GNAT superfamily N-acetyltransferase
LLEPDALRFTDEEEWEWIHEHTDDEGEVLLAAAVNDSVVGLLGFENGPQRRVAHRGSLHVSVARPWPGQGIGTLLLKSLLAWAAGRTRSNQRCDTPSLFVSTARRHAPSSVCAALGARTALGVAALPCPATRMTIAMAGTNRWVTRCGLRRGVMVRQSLGSQGKRMM